MITKHVEEILELFRNNHLKIQCVLDQYSSYKIVDILNTNLYPEPQNSEVFLLENNKSINVEDLEFAEITTINNHKVVFLGNFRFYFDKSVFNL